MLSIHQSIYRFSTALFLLAVLLLSGCAAASYSKGQKAFSRGTELRNLQEVGIDLSASGIDLGQLYDFTSTTEGVSAEQQFILAREQLTKALKQKAKLRRDGLLANAHLLLGLTEFQLGNYTVAQEQAAAARTIFSEDESIVDLDGGRDFALSYALNPIVTVTELYDSIKILVNLPVVAPSDSNATTLVLADFYQRRLTAEGNMNLEGALKALDFAIEKATDSRETKQYLRNYQMAALLNNRTLLDRFLIAGQQSGTFQRQGAALQNQFLLAENRLDELVEDYRLALLAVSPQGENDPFYRFWKGKVF